MRVLTTLLSLALIVVSFTATFGEENPVKKAETGCCEDARPETPIELSADSIEVQKIRIGKSDHIVVVRFHAGSVFDKDLKSPKGAADITQNNIRTIVVVGSEKGPVDIAAVTGPKAGLGNGRCSCRHWVGLSCKRTGLNQDCVDKQAFFNRCGEICDTTCGNWNATWTRDPNCK
jgi:hypothetical protein